MGMDHSKQVLVDLQHVAVDCIMIAKHGVGLGAMGQLFSVVADVKDLIAAAPAALPELKSLDKAEAEDLAACAYDAIKAVMVALAA